MWLKSNQIIDFFKQDIKLKILNHELNLFDIMLERFSDAKIHFIVHMNHEHNLKSE